MVNEWLKKGYKYKKQHICPICNSGTYAVKAMKGGDNGGRYFSVAMTRYCWKCNKFFRNKLEEIL